jgi:hypothetical protein
MGRYLSGVLLLLLPVLVRAADVEPPAAPSDVSPWGLIIFAVVFLGMVVGFAIFIWLKERARKHNQTRS